MRFVSKIGLVLAVAAVGVPGCQSPDRRSDRGTAEVKSDRGADAPVKPDGGSVARTEKPDSDKPTVALAPAPGPIEVREEEYESGAVAKREEGYIDASGNFVRHGLASTWYEDGAKKSEIGYAHGKQHGPRITWYPTGQMWGRGQYVDGLEDGTWTAWWPNGFKQREWHMDHGTWHGPFNEWHDNGEKKMEFEYVDGLKQGMMRIWDPRGTLVHESEYIDDVEQPK